MNIEQHEKQKQLKLKQYRDEVSEMESAIKYMKGHVYLIITKNKLGVIPFESLYKTQDDKVSNTIWEMELNEFSKSKFENINYEEIVFETMEEFENYIGDLATKTNISDLYNKDVLKPIAKFGLSRDILSSAKASVEKIKKSSTATSAHKTPVTKVDGKIISTDEFMKNHLKRQEKFKTYDDDMYILYETKGLKHELYVCTYSMWGGVEPKNREYNVTDLLIPLDESKLNGVSSKLNFEKNWELISAEATHRSELAEYYDSWD